MWLGLHGGTLAHTAWHGAFIVTNHRSLDHNLNSLFIPFFYFFVAAAAAMTTAVA